MFGMEARVRGSSTRGVALAKASAAPNLRSRPNDGNGARATAMDGVPVIAGA